MTPEQIPIAEFDRIKTQAAKEYPRWGDKIYDNRGYAGYCRGAQAEYLRHLSTPSDTGARWVKASERLPRQGRNVSARSMNFGMGGQYNHTWMIVKDGVINIDVDACAVDFPNLAHFLDDWEWLDEGPAPAPLQENGIREAIAARLKELESLIGYVKRERADLPRGSLNHKQATADIEEYRVRYDELNKLPSSSLPLSDKK